MIVITIFNFVKRKQWRYFLRKITQKCGDLNDTRRENSNLIFNVIVWHFIFAFAKGLKVYYDFQEFKLHGLARLLQEYYCFLSALIASCLAHCIRKKYEDLGKLLREYIITPANDIIMSTRIINVGKKFRCISELVECYNDMFGWLIILTLLKVIVGILKWANLLIVCMGHEQVSLVMIVPLLCYTFLGFAGSMLIILSCDAASSAGGNIQRDCYELQERLHIDSRSREELFKLSKIVKSYYPRFTAANLFVIRRSTILRIINIVTAYIIVMIQLREKYDKPDKSKIYT
ncbi:uncharacterized protein [Leptinotarsa decemlineata]|uniref:uncharacterized protein n=1 Tax=Leptinotarsa decemlineata TaxID=7539 RepID=UPI003D30C117